MRLSDKTASIFAIVVPTGIANGNRKQYSSAT
jgi:hypothetical protein